MNDNNDTTTTAADALREMRARGIDNAPDLLEHATPEAILTACRHWDTRKDVGAGLLAKWIRQGGISEATADRIVKGQDARRRQAFDKFVREFPVGSVVERHSETQELMWPDDPNRCPGAMRVEWHAFPHVALVCDECGFETAIGISPPGAQTPRGVPAPVGRSAEELF